MSAGSWSWSRSALVVTGAVAAAIWILGLDWVRLEFLTLFGASDSIELDGPFGLPAGWWDEVPAVAGALGLVAIVAAFARTRVLAVVLVLGTVYLLAWLIDPPHVFEAQGRSATAYLWPAYVATAAIALAAAVSFVRARGTARGR